MWMCAVSSCFSDKVEFAPKCIHQEERKIFPEVSYQGPLLTSLRKMVTVVAVGNALSAFISATFPGRDHIEALQQTKSRRLFDGTGL